MTKHILSIFVLSLIFISCAQKEKVSLGEDDPLVWLEEVEGQKALSWVEEKNKTSLAQLTKAKDFSKIEKAALEILQSKDKIPYVRMLGPSLYNFWQDEKSVRGVLRRTTLSSYKNKNVKWETVLDLDQLAKKEKENWVYKSLECLAPEYRRCLIGLSRGGKDATVIREFDLKSKTFVSNGFTLTEAKTYASWIDKDQIFVATDFGPDSLTESGYPKVVKIWKRGEDLNKAQVAFTGTKKDMLVYGYQLENAENKITMISNRTDFFTSKEYVYEKGQLKALPSPESAELSGYFKDHFILALKKDWSVGGQTLNKGSLVALSRRVVEKQKVESTDVVVLFEPSANSTTLGVQLQKDYILINALENVRGKVYRIGFNQGQFLPALALDLVPQAHLSIVAATIYDNNFFFKQEDFLKPETLYFFDSSNGKSLALKSLPAQFNNQGMVVEQKWATSLDGTKVPYFLMGKKSVIAKKNAPTLLYGYGGFEVSVTPAYKNLVGKLWLEKDGLYVIANIRGGGEFGPKWHQSALQTKRHKAYDDFIAVAEDLIKTNVTSKDRLAIQGGSNGGLLVGAVMTRRPDLFKSVLCHVPLLDMIRYSQLLAGASWMAEYGDPREPEMNRYLRSYSPYHNVKAEVKYPDLFLITSTKDDRVHPGHARKMALKMENLGHKNLLYYENTEGGHAASANLKQSARMRALTFEFLYQTLL